MELLQTYEIPGVDMEALDDATRGLTGDALIAAVAAFLPGNAK